MFKITITETKTEEKQEKGEYTIIDERPFTQEEFNEANQNWQEKADAGKTKNIFGYPPARMVTKTVEREIYKQEVDQLNLADVIKAINGME